MLHTGMPERDFRPALEVADGPRSHSYPDSPKPRLRWGICALLFFATTINYIDRQVLGILAVPLQRTIGWSEADYGFIVTAFQAAYAIALVALGRIIDRIGTRLGYAFSVAFWSVAAMCHALARSPFAFAAARFALGLGEAGNFPAAIKTVAEWFPKSERALATGIFNSGSNVGAIIGPLIVPWIALHWGWRWAFVLTGALGFVWIVPWLLFYRRPPVSPDETASTAQTIPWSHLIPHRATWALVVARFMTDPVWWFYLYWIPKFLNQHHGIDLEQLALPLILIYVAADVGSIFGGWLSSTLLKRGWTAGSARKMALLVCALLVTPIVAAPWVSDLWAVVALLCLATAGHQGWSANLYTLVSDVFPKQAVASVVGLSGFGGSVGGMLVASATGLILQATGSYVAVFAWGASAYVIALGLLHLIAPQFTPVDLTSPDVRN
ncbi:MAG: putative hexuronate transporter protein, partial [Bryobacterales bacterium]|nr:putative hexuronate transporter protein [Bryobacterales bacterium]